jgi:hypothetical protein
LPENRNDDTFAREASWSRFLGLDAGRWSLLFLGLVLSSFGKALRTLLWVAVKVCVLREALLERLQNPGGPTAIAHRRAQLFRRSSWRPKRPASPIRGSFKANLPKSKNSLSSTLGQL